jgi:hypothetical protein
MMTLLGAACSRLRSDVWKYEKGTKPVPREIPRKQRGVRLAEEKLLSDVRAE